MKSLHDIEIVGPSDIWGYLLHRGLPIVLAGLLMLWLSGGGGLVPPTLTQFFYILFHFGALLSQPGTILSLILFLIQLAILATAWVFYVKIVIKAIEDLRELIAQVEQSQALALAELSNHQLAVQKLEEQARRAQTAPQWVSTPPTWRAPSSPVPSAEATMRAQPVHSGENINPFDDDEKSDGSFLLDQPSVSQSTSAQRPAVQPSPPPQPAISQQPQPVAPMQPQPVAQQPQPQPAMLRRNVDPYAANMGDIFSDLPADPFATEQPGQPPKAQKKGQAAPAKAPQPQQPSMPELPNEFIFGNPFEGQLPDVFNEDEDLKRSLGDLPAFPPQQ